MLGLFFAMQLISQTIISTRYSGDVRADLVADGEP